MELGSLWQKLLQYLRPGENLSGRRPDPRASESAPATPTASQQETTCVRKSFALAEFLTNLSAGSLRQRVWVLDLGGASQQNVLFLTERGHVYYALDLLALLEELCPSSEFISAQQRKQVREKILNEFATFPDNSFQGILAWDRLELLAPALLEQVLTQLSRLIAPGGALLAVFHAVTGQQTVPVYSYRILNEDQLLLAPQALRPAARFYNNRELELLFTGFETIKFYLTQDQLREVIAKK